MSVLLETKSGLKRRLQITVDAQKMTASYDSKLGEHARKANFKGFRPGKVPKTVVQRYYGEALRQQVREEFVQSSFESALETEGLRLAGQPEIANLPDWMGEGDFIYEVDFEVYPTVELGDFSGMTIKKYDVEVKPLDVEESLDQLRDQNIDWEPVERAAEDGDTVVIDYAGTINGESFDGGSGKDMSVHIGSNNMIPGFEEGLIGIEKGVSRELKLVFPDDYHAKKLAGESVEFMVEAKEVKAGAKPELDDEFAKKLNLQSVDELREKVLEEMQRNAKDQLAGKQKDIVMDVLLEAYDFELPEVLLDAERKYLESAAKANEDSSIDIEEQAQRRVKLGVLLSEIVRHYDIKVSQSAVQQRIMRMSGGSREIMNWLYSDKNRLVEIETAVLEDQVVDRILQDVTQDTCHVDFKDLPQLLNEDNEQGESDNGSDQ